MAFITSASVALVVVAAEQRRRGDWSDLTVDQLQQIGKVLDEDRHNQLTRDQCVIRLRSLGGWTPPEAA